MHEPVQAAYRELVSIDSAILTVLRAWCPWLQDNNATSFCSGLQVGKTQSLCYMFTRTCNCQQHCEDHPLRIPSPNSALSGQPATQLAVHICTNQRVPVLVLLCRLD